MKKALQIIYTLSILLFGILWVLNKFDVLIQFNSVAFRNFLVFIFLFSRLKYFQMELKDKNTEIQDLKSKLNKTRSEKTFK